MADSQPQTRHFLVVTVKWTGSQSSLQPSLKETDLPTGIKSIYDKLGYELSYPEAFLSSFHLNMTTSHDNGQKGDQCHQGSQRDGSFRSLLPHEPLPSPKDEKLGYLHIQGAFTPKILHDESAGEGVTETTRDDNPHTPFWTRESLLAALRAALGQSPSNGEEKAKYRGTLDLPFPPVEIEVLDEIPPFTRVRLTYESAVAAYHATVVMKSIKLSASDLFKLQYTQSGSGVKHSFARRPLQITPITLTQLPPIELAWNRSNRPKFRRLLPRPGEDLSQLESERRSTRFVYISKLLEISESESLSGPRSHACWTDPHCTAEAIRSVVNKFDSSGLGVEVFVSHKKSFMEYCHVGMRSAEDAQTLIRDLQEKEVEWSWVDATGNTITTRSGKLFLDYATLKYRSAWIDAARKEGEKGEPSRSECTSQTSHVQVPGLILIPEFVSEREEETLMAVLTGPHAPWAPSQKTSTVGGVVKRQVQHYGYVFDYETADVLRDRSVEKACCPPMPALSKPVDTTKQLKQITDDCIEEGRGWDALANLIERTRRRDFEGRSFPNINQMTVNKYAPGEGIGSHVDTPSAFGDGLISISLNSGIVMEFRKVSSSDGDSRKLVYLPRRSLLLMSGPARYEWKHMIVTRMTDTHDGQVLQRGTRVSLTLRTALDEVGNTMPLVESFSFPPVWDSKRNESSFATPSCEKEHVHAVYDAIATQWHHTRGRRGVLWPGATQFLQRLPPGSVVADVGCGDGKYFPAIWEAGSYVIGTDISVPLLKTAALKDELPNVADNRIVSDGRQHLRDRPAVAAADCMSVPLRSSSCDAAICIAVLHHISTLQRRIRCVEELARIVKPGGMINIQAWAMDQQDGSRHKFAANDVFVPFNAQPKYLALGDTENITDRENGGAEKAGSLAQVYSQAFNAEYDDHKGLVVFKRYCHLYRAGELDAICGQVSNVKLVESGYESGNYFVILEVL